MGGAKKSVPARALVVIILAECSRIFERSSPFSLRNFSTCGYFSKSERFASKFLSLSLFRKNSDWTFSSSKCRYDLLAGWVIKTSNWQLEIRSQFFKTDSNLLKVSSFPKIIIESLTGGVNFDPVIAILRDIKKSPVL